LRRLQSASLFVFRRTVLRPRWGRHWEEVRISGDARIMGGSTTLIGLMPTFKTIGWFAPIALIVIRILQGLAIGGEYGGAAIYVGEHSPDNKRGLYTSFIQITAILALFISFLVILGTQSAMSEQEFANWGWRIPFLLSLVLVAISLYIRLKLRESPIFALMKSGRKNLDSADQRLLHRMV